jgi:hypothetical protein
LQGDLAAHGQRPQPWYARLAAILAILGLAALLALQYAWLAPQHLLARAPVARPWLERMSPWLDAASGVFGWAREPPRDLASIRVLERDIREHPARPGALLVRALFLNEASFAQRAPRVRLTLFDVTGVLLAQRVFEPAEYLHGEDPGLQVPSGSPIQLRLELLAPPTPAVSYQIEFL